MRLVFHYVTTHRNGKEGFMTADRPRTYALLGQIAKFHCFPEETEGKYCFVEIISPPGTGAPPNHHAGEMETFFMTSSSRG